jgi:signal transduction histidine kinase
MLSISLSVSAIIEKDKVTAVIGVFRDITIEKKQEQQSADFLSTASHEMRTPIAAIEGYLSLALNDNVSTIDSRARTYLEKAHSSTQSLGKLFQDLLTSSKVEDGRLVSHPSVVEISSLLSEVTGDLKFLAQKKGLILEFVLGTGKDNDPPSGKDTILSPLYYVYADPERLREVLVNLFDNAIKFSSKGKITFGVTGDDKVVQFYVKDHGSGIPEEDIPHLFQKFYRVDNSITRTTNGTGLGLFICRKIIELYQGKIWVESKLGEGSTFFINLPRISEQRISQLQGSAPPKSTNLT